MSVRKITASIVALGTVLSSPGWAFAEGPAPVQLVKSAAGFTFNYHRIPSAKRLAVVVTLPADVSLSPKGREALPYIASAHMLMGGANSRSSSALKAEFRDLNSVFDIRTRKRGVTVLLATPPDGAKQAANLANQIIAKPNLDEKWLKRIQSLMVKRFDQAASSLKMKAALASRDYAMGSHPYTQVEPFRSREVIRSVTREDVVAWHRDVFVKKHIMITASGPIDNQAVGPIIDRLLHGLPARPLNTHPEMRPAHLQWDGKTIVLLDKTAKKSSVMISGEVERTKSLSNLRSAIAAQILGSGPHSKLFKALRSELGLTYHVGARLLPLSLEKGVLIMEGEFETTKLALAVSTLKKTYAEFLRAGSSMAELEAARDSFSTELRRRINRPIPAALMMMSLSRNLLPPQAIVKAADSVANTTRQDLNAHIVKHWPQPNRVLTVVVTSNATSIEADCIIRSLAEIEKCRDQS